MSETELKTMCQNGQDFKGQYLIYKVLDEMKKFGRFGNADLLNKDDWRDVNFDTSFSNKLGSRVWNNSTNSCDIYSSVLIKVVYAEMGFDESPEKYIQDITVSSY
jgi:hypothetical protein